MRHMRRMSVWGAIVGLWLVLALPALAQSGSVRVEDPDGLLGSGAADVRAAAERLAAEGAEVIVIVAGPSAGNSETSALDFLRSYLNQNNIAPVYDNLEPNQIVFYVANQARGTWLYYGSRWVESLDPVGQRIRDQQMNPRFAEGDLAGGMVAGIDAARTTINPPTSPFVYLVGGVVAVGALVAVVGPVLRRRRVTAEALAGARERMEQARRAAGAAIADLGQLARQADEKDDYDRISYSSTDVERLQTIQGDGMQLFQQAQAAFDAAEEQQNAKATLTSQDYTTITAQYETAQDLAQRAAARVGEAERLRAQLDTQPKPSTGPTQRLGE